VPTLADYPELVAQLDRKKNGALEPASITYASGRRLWWRCPEGPDHLWEAPVRRRTAGHDCPCCVNLKLSVTNTLAVVAPCGFHLAGAVEQARSVAGALAAEGLADVPVWAIDADGIVVRPGPRLVNGVEALAAILHPRAVPAPPPGTIQRVR